MPTELPVADIEAAEAAIQFAKLVRKTHARRTHKTHPRRVADIGIALARLKETMRPLKSHIGRFASGPQTSLAQKNRERILETSQAIQRERRKLWKMKSPKEPKNDQRV